MKKIVAIGIIFVFLLISFAFAQNSIKAEVDKTKINTDETLTYKLIITSSETKLPPPQIPKFEGFKVLSQAQSSTLSFVKGGVKTILVYAFILSPTEKGKFKIRPCVIKIKDKTYSSDTFEIEVTQGRAKPESPPEQKPSLPKRTQPESEEPQTIL